MALKEFFYRGKTTDELKRLSLNEFMALLPARQRRSLKRGFTEQQKIFMKRLEKKGNNVKTHCRDLVIVPAMLQKIILVHNGRAWVAVNIAPEMLGHVLGEFTYNRKKVSHSAPGIGATRSSAALSVR